MTESDASVSWKRVEVVVDGGADHTELHGAPDVLTYKLSGRGTSICQGTVVIRVTCATVPDRGVASHWMMRKEGHDGKGVNGRSCRVRTPTHPAFISFYLSFLHYFPSGYPHLQSFMRTW